MKILYSSTYNTLSGGNRSLLGLIDKELEIGNDVVAITPFDKDSSPIYSELLKRKIQQKRIHFTTYAFGPYSFKIGPRRIINELLAELQILFFMMKCKPDVFHINTLSSTNGFYAAKLLGIPIVWHIREFVEEDYNFVFYERDKLFRMLRTSDAVIAISKTIQESFKKKIHWDYIDMIYNGIDVDYYSIKNKKIFQKEQINIGIVGRIIPGKGQIDAVNAINELHRRGIDNVTLHIYGGEPEEEYFEKLKKTIVENKVNAVIEGCLFNMLPAYESLDILLVCSKFEPFGRVTIEGMLAGCLVVGSNTAGTAELIEHGVNGLCYQEGNVLALADALQYALSNKEIMKDISQNAQKWAKENFSAEKNAQRINEIYTRVVKKL